MVGIAKSVTALGARPAALGLEKGAARVVAHDPRWIDLAQALCDDIRAHLAVPGTEVDHIGSTAVADLVAKPILDIAVGLPAGIDTTAVIPTVEELGLRYDMDLGDYGGLLFLLEVDPDIVVVNLHVVEIDGFQWRWYRSFRDGLRADAELRAEYERLKRLAADNNADDRDGYNRDKYEWVLARVRALADDI